MDQAAPLNVADFVERVPPAWFPTRQGNSIWVSGYRVLRVPRESLATGPKVLDLGNMLAIIVYGVISYLGSDEPRIKSEGDDWVIEFRSSTREGTEGSYLFLVTPFSVTGQPGDEPGTRERVSAAAGLFAVHNGRNMVYEHLFDNIVEMDSRATQGFGPAADLPAFFPKPDLGDPRLSTIAHGFKAFAGMTESEKNMVSLSLRWFEQAIYDDGIDGYLKYWIAVETLTMPDTTNVRPSEEGLARAYGMTYEAARSRFQVGRLQGLRSRIVHEGQRVPIHQELLKYIEALYVDLILEKLGLACERRAEALTNQPGFDLDQYLHEH